MRNWLVPLISGMLGMSILTLAVLLALPFLSRRYRKRTLYGLLIVCLIGFLIPWRPLLTPRAAVTLEVPSAALRQVRPLTLRPENVMPEADSQRAHPAINEQPASGSRTTWNWGLILGLLWSGGAAAVIICEIMRYIRLVRLLNRWREPPDSTAASIFEQEAATAGLRHLPRLWVAPCISGPMVMGLIRPAVYLSVNEMTEADLRLIIRHELTHIRQGDLYVKWLTMIVCAIHWLNPAVWLLRRSLNQFCELSCDERIMAGSDLAERQQYSETLIAAIRVNAKAPTILCTAFQGGLKRMKRRILNIMDMHIRRNSITAVAMLLCLTVLTGSLLSFTSADILTKLPDFADSYDREAEELELFDTPYPAYTADYAPAYNFSDDPEYPAALYVPGTPIEITGHKWRAEHIPGVTGTDGMVWLQVNPLVGEPLVSVWMPETFISISKPQTAASPHGILKAGDGQTHVSVYAHITDKAPIYSAESGREAALISWQPGWAQVRVGNATGYVDSDQLVLGEDVTACLQPAWMYGFDSWRLGYGSYYNQYLTWFGQMEDLYGSSDMWSVEMKAVGTQVQSDYGLLKPGDVAYTLPGEGDISVEEAIAIGKRLIGDNDSVDELGIPYYAWQANFMYIVGEDAEPYWQLRAWATHTDMDRQNLRLTRTGELIGEITPFRDVKNPEQPYYSVSLMLLYGEMDYTWPAAVRTAYDPVGCPPLQDGWKTEDEVRTIAMDAIEAAFGAEKLAKVKADFDIYASYYNYGRYDENESGDRIFWTVRCINRTPGDAEEIQVMVNMDGTLRGEPIDNYYGDIDFTPGSNG